jgi:hypothetical protein
VGDEVVARNAEAAVAVKVNSPHPRPALVWAAAVRPRSMAGRKITPHVALNRAVLSPLSVVVQAAQATGKAETIAALNGTRERASLLAHRKSSLSVPRPRMLTHRGGTFVPSFYQEFPQYPRRGNAPVSGLTIPKGDHA